MHYWIENAVIGLDLCPFSKTVYRKNKIHYVVSESVKVEALMIELYQQCEYLIETPEIETTLLIIPDQFQKYAGLATGAATRTYYKANREKIDNQIKAGRQEAQKRIGTKARGLTSSLRK